jgi:hypothetical protein
MYENYLLIPDAVTAIINDIEGFRNTEVSSQEVEKLMAQKLADPTYHRPLTVGTLEQRLKTVNGAKLLHDIFGELSEARVTYDKMRHSIALTDWILEHEPGKLHELSDLVIRTLDSGRSKV